MSRMIVTILLALCISQYASAAVVSNSRNDIKKMKGEVETLLEILKLYNENYISEFAKTEETAENNLKPELIKNVDAAFDEIKNAAQEKGNSAKINQCVEAAKAKLDRLKVNSLIIFKYCVGIEEEEEANNLIKNLNDKISTGNNIQGLIESLEKDENVEKKLPNVRASLDKLEDTATDLMKEGDKIMKRVENLFKECSNEQLIELNFSIEKFKVNALQCISQA